MQKILRIIIEKGARLAEPGEFTKRAFLNGRIDLTQVESIASILNAKSEEELKISGELLEGKLRNKMIEIKEKLMEVLMHLEVNIDYPEYDTEEKSEKEVRKTIKETKDILSKFEKTFDVGSKIMDGIKVSIIGRPNAGKSSLLNNILNKERAIVTEIEGTTRDSIEEIITINGLPIKIIDTAGIRETEEKVEKIGIERAIELAKESDIVVAIFDISKELNEDDKKILEIIENKENIVLLNKYDILNSEENLKDREKEEKIKEILKGKDYILASMTKRQGIDEMLEKIGKKVEKLKENKNNDIIIIHERQKNIIVETIERLRKVEEEMKIYPIDMVSESIREVIGKLNELTGENVKEEMLDEIFRNFCLGK